MMNKLIDDVFRTSSRPAVNDRYNPRHLHETIILPMLSRELQHRRNAAQNDDHAVELIAWVEVG